eukprot:gnl/MRDRNA2_/MRDRNA2_78497_c0_seq1.p1 gnl/MRDRNA2_/MRDRNA2_78497_c0~~gnl/MRDRNA2_/MRDRNA2_78497_c0_seq1.p1  ORF type:complete len:156 (-),score=5.79 gnl/MRDRNA2_/MRDRNA2_78497_c0_seq1:20-457(-)
MAAVKDDRVCYELVHNDLDHIVFVWWGHIDAGALPTDPEPSDWQPPDWELNPAFNVHLLRPGNTTGTPKPLWLAMDHLVCAQVMPPENVTLIEPVHDQSRPPHSKCSKEPVLCRSRRSPKKVGENFTWNTSEILGLEYGHLLCES